jgi:uncharacterized protein (DUF433 family)
MSAFIVERTDGPRVAGTRITVYDVVYWLEVGKSAEEIGAILRLSTEQVQAALRYIDSHREAVMAVHRQIEARNAQGNPPAIRAKLEASRAKLKVELERRRRARSQEATTDAGADGR